ncbi:hypothetical protein Hanom_Chr00s028225g01767661 [Helianthus anomalus]
MDPKATKQGEQPRSSQASRAATSAQAEGESSSSSDSDDTDFADELNNNDLDKDDAVRLAPRKWLKPLPDQTQKKRCVNTKGEYLGQIRSWEFDEQHSLVTIKRMDGVQYFRPRVKYLKTRPARDLHHLASLDLKNHTK